MAGGCPVPGSTSVAPIEQAIMSYCSDIMNLQALYGHDRSAASRHRVLESKKAAEEIKSQLEKLTDATLASSADGTPLVFARRARQLETELEQAEGIVVTAERDLAMLSRKNIAGLDEKWRELAAGVVGQDAAVRLRARQLVADTFEKIVVYHHGVSPDDEATQRDYHIDLLLIAKGGNTRSLRVDRAGNWVQGEDYSAA